MLSVNKVLRKHPSVIEMLKGQDLFLGWQSLIFGVSQQTSFVKLWVQLHVCVVSLSKWLPRKNMSPSRFGHGKKGYIDLLSVMILLCYIGSLLWRFFLSLAAVEFHSFRNKDLAFSAQSEHRGRRLSLGMVSMDHSCLFFYLVSSNFKILLF